MLKPLSSDQWNYATAAHLLNRGGFGGSPTEIEKLCHLGPDKAVAHLAGLRKHSRPDAESRLGQARSRRDPPVPRGHQERRHAGGKKANCSRSNSSSFSGGMHGIARLVAATHGARAAAVPGEDGFVLARPFRHQRRKGPRILITCGGRTSCSAAWPPATGSSCSPRPARTRPCSSGWIRRKASKEHPNENFAREVMELFTLGEGHYTEHDITEAARALTGWSLDRHEQKFIYRPLHPRRRRQDHFSAGREISTATM